MPDDAAERTAKAINRRLSNARREIIRAVERAAKVDEQIGLRPGHRIEAVRRIREVQAEADRAVEAFNG